MTRKEFVYLLKNDKKNPLFLEAMRNYHRVKKVWKPVIDAMKEIRPGKRVVLHHVFFNCTNYEKWECIPMYQDDHVQLHKSLGTYKTGLSAWNKGLTKENNNRVLKYSIKRKGVPGKKHTEEWKKVMSSKMSGTNNPFYGKKHSKETLQKISEKASEKVKGLLWWNNGIENKRSKVCPGEEWTLGRLWPNGKTICSNKRYKEQQCQIYKAIH